jgi:hypothetical protein
MAKLILTTLDGTLDAFVQDYCEMANIHLDGDAMGVMFSGKDRYTTLEAVTLIEEGADAYRLRMGTAYWQDQFPDFTDMPDIPADWEDTSWHNDTCPSFEVGAVRVFIDYANPVEREIIGDYPRFSVIDHDQNTIVATDDWATVLATVAKHP